MSIGAATTRNAAGASPRARPAYGSSTAPLEALVTWAA